MSRTERTKDYYYDPERSPLWKQTADKKHWYKPTKGKWLERMRSDSRANHRKAMVGIDEDNQIVLPVRRMTDEWNYN